MSQGERVYFQPGANPPFPGYEAWLEEVKRGLNWLVGTNLRARVEFLHLILTCRE